MDPRLDRSQGRWFQGSIDPKFDTSKVHLVQVSIDPRLDRSKGRWIKGLIDPRVIDPKVGGSKDR